MPVVKIKVNGIVREFETVNDDRHRVEPMCPKCGAPESHPLNADQCLVRAYKVEMNGKWWSQCLVCAGYYNSKLVFDQAFGNDKKGWFA